MCIASGRAPAHKREDVLWMQDCEGSQTDVLSEEEKTRAGSGSGEVGRGDPSAQISNQLVDTVIQQAVRQSERAF